MNRENQYDITELLDWIDPSSLDYTDWVNVGMALKDAGYPCSVWDDWSRRDGSRYHTGECFSKWDGFHGAAVPVTAGTIVQMAKENGWCPATGGHELDWNDVIGEHEEGVVVRAGWLESREVREPDSGWDPVHDLITYLDTLFNDDENVGYVTEVWEKDDRLVPTSGYYDRTAGQLKAALRQCKGDMGAALGDSNPIAGAWIRFNPLDGKGVKNENVTDFRYALVESDETEIEQQNAILRELELPIAALVHSGKKSLHAIVRVDAQDYPEYRKRVEYLYEICAKNGLKPDKQNKNPSRLSRMPGIMRNGHKQFLVDTNIGKANWDQWKEWIESVNDDLPDPEPLESVWGNMPDLAAPLIDGVLRKGHKMLLAGPSKAGKSFALIEMVIALAEGKRWLGFPCARGRVLYVNLELDRASCLHRFRDVYDALHWRPEHLNNIDIWNLRGSSVPMDKLAPKLIRRAAKKNYAAVVIDPIYKVLTGDENSADQMAAFCNQFDKVCHELGAAVIYCHHHSKGYQGQKRSMDRASGSGVFARDPDALLDLVQLETTPDLLRQQEGRAACDAIAAWLNTYAKDWQQFVGQDDALSENNFLAALRDVLNPEQLRAVNETAEKAKSTARQRTAWRIEGTLREFPRFEPVNVWFDYPVHRADDTGALRDIRPEGEIPPRERGTKSAQKSYEVKRIDRNLRIMQAYEKLEKKRSPVPAEDLFKELCKGEDGPGSERSFGRWIKECPGLERSGKMIFRNEDDDDEIPFED